MTDFCAFIFELYKLEIVKKKMLTIAFQIFYNDDYRQGDEFIFYDLSREGQCVANCVVLKAL